MVKRLNKACKFFPCHKPEGGGLASNSQSHRGLEDCTFCYCPFYPCLNKDRGGYVFSPKQKKGIWSCKDCSWIHQRSVTDNIFALIRENKRRMAGDKFLPNHGIPGLKSGKAGVIILSHGSRIKKANASLERTIRMIKRKIGSDIVLPAYFQFYQPDLAKSVKDLISRGCRKAVIIPFFLFNGNHVSRDIPRIIREERAKYPGVEFVYRQNLGQDPRIADIVIDIIEEAFAK